MAAITGDCSSSTLKRPRTLIEVTPPQLTSKSLHGPYLSCSDTPHQSRGKGWSQRLAMSDKEDLDQKLCLSRARETTAHAYTGNASETAVHSAYSGHEVEAQWAPHCSSPLLSDAGHSSRKGKRASSGQH